ncbi:MAG: sulfite exporter TauE/SafE family protein [Actinomycetota bacterium]|nr:sulfite exporter TauE/SafE family protein [Actinomycetota bacterium]
MDLLLPMFTLGLVTSLHCVSMCGPMVVSYALKGAKDDTWAARITPNLAYQAAKILSYMLVGLVLGAVGSALNLDAIRPYVMVAAGLFMIVLALGMTGKFPWAARLTPKPPKFLVTALSRVGKKARTDAEAGVSSLGTPVTFGLLTGLFPCAPLIAAQLNAAAAGSPGAGALAMLAFGLGTAPLMLVFGTASSLIPKRLKERAMVALAVVVLAFGLVYLNRGAMLLGSPVTAQSIRQAVLGGPTQQTTPAEEYQAGADGVVEVPLTIANVQFQPSVVSIPADQPVRLVVDRQEASACSDQLAVPQLGVLVDLEPFATTIVDLPAAKAGSYTLTCGMGMMSGQLSVGGAGASAVGQNTVPVLFGAAGIAGGLIFMMRRKPVAATAGRNRKTGAGQTTPAPASLFGFTPMQLIAVGATIGVAVMMGLVLGGAFA